MTDNNQTAWWSREIDNPPLWLRVKLELPWPDVYQRVGMMLWGRN